MGMLSTTPNEKSLTTFVFIFLIGTFIFSLFAASPSSALALNQQSGNRSVAVKVYSDNHSLTLQEQCGDRSWYGDSASFSSSYSLKERYYDGSSVGIEVTSKCAVDGSFNVSLYRNGTFVAAATLKRNGFSRAEWLNVGPGGYSFRFTKSADGAIIHCTDIALFSW